MFCLYFLRGGEFRRWFGGRRCFFSHGRLTRISYQGWGWRWRSQQGWNRAILWRFGFCIDTSKGKGWTHRAEDRGQFQGRSRQVQLLQAKHISSLSNQVSANNNKVCDNFNLFHHRYELCGHYHNHHWLYSSSLLLYSWLYIIFINFFIIAIIVFVIFIILVNHQYFLFQHIYRKLDAASVFLWEQIDKLYVMHCCKEMLRALVFRRSHSDKGLQSESGWTTLYI